MPELPEVQTVVDELVAAGLAGTEVTGACVYWAGCIAEPSVARFLDRLPGQVVRAVRRRGKYIVFELSAGHLLVHLRMAGRLHLAARGDALPQHVRLALKLAGGRELRLHDTRKFGRAYLVDDPAPLLDRLGVEPLSRQFHTAGLAALLAGRRRMIKPLLLDQTLIAGLGNIYVDEALWEAGLHPQRRSDGLDRREVKALRRAIARVLKRAIRNRGTSLGRGRPNFTTTENRSGGNRPALNVYGRTGQPCRRCGDAVRKFTVGQRGTHFCRSCQPPGPASPDETGSGSATG